LAPGEPPQAWSGFLEVILAGAAESPGMNMVGMEATTDSRPIHRVYVDGFWMDTTEVTNAQFAKFVEATGYVTIAERAPRAEDFPGAPPENLVAGAVGVPAPALVGSQVTVNWTVTNEGEAATSTSWVDQVYFSPNGQLTGATLLGSHNRDRCREPSL
jgi:formylglycine-generating enzyme required for sulfatase activity